MTRRDATLDREGQDEKSRRYDPVMIDNLHFVKELGHRSLEAIESGNLAELGRLLHTHWEHEK